jgi:hypothetical protein
MASSKCRRALLGFGRRVEIICDCVMRARAYLNSYRRQVGSRFAKIELAEAWRSMRTRAAMLIRTAGPRVLAMKTDEYAW